jgi:hypothetical protein
MGDHEMSDAEDLERRARSGDVEAMLEYGWSGGPSWLSEFLALVSETKLLVGEEESDVIRCATRGDVDAKRRLVESNLRMVISVTKDYRERGVRFGDLISVGAAAGAYAAARVSADDDRPHVLLAQYVRQVALTAITDPTDATPFAFPGCAERVCGWLNAFVAANEDLHDGLPEPTDLATDLRTLVVTSPALTCLEHMERSLAQEQRHKMDWYERAASLGSGEAMRRLADLASAAGDRATSRVWAERGFEAGSADCAARLGFFAYVEGDVATAVEWWERGADRGSVKAMVNRGAYAKEVRDLDGYRSWSLRAAECGSPIGMNNVGDADMEAGDAVSARSWFAKAASEKAVVALANVGLLERDAGNRDAAKAWWRLAALSGEINAIRCLAEAAEDDGDADEARDLWSRGAHYGDLESTYRLGESWAAAGHVAKGRYYIGWAEARGFQPQDQSEGES